MSDTMRDLTIDEMARVTGGTSGSTSPPLLPSASQSSYTPYGCNGCKLLDWWWPGFVF